MGSITYDRTCIEFDDRLLAHLHVVIMQKFRRGESFPMSWLDSIAIGDGRSSIWMAPTVPVYFKFAGSRMASISRDWITALTLSAGSSTGLIVSNEDGTAARAGMRYDVGDRNASRR
jgi:hypothetical protein